MSSETGHGFGARNIIRASYILEGNDNDHQTGDSVTGNSQPPADAADRVDVDAVAFYPISLGDEQDDDDDTTTAGKSTRTTEKLQKNKKWIICNTDQPTPLLEHAIQDCFQLAIDTHDATSVDVVEKAMWHPWNYTHNTENNHDNDNPLQDKTAAAIPQVDWDKEQEALRSWVPRPLSLPTWAVQD
jgi:hypothetical protein